MRHLRKLLICLSTNLLILLVLTTYNLPAGRHGLQLTTFSVSAQSNCPTSSGYVCISTNNYCYLIGGDPSSQYVCDSGGVCCDVRSHPTPTISVFGTPTPTPIGCVPSNDPGCTTNLIRPYALCPGTFTCCDNPNKCPPPDPFNLPLCGNNNDCQLDWVGSFMNKPQIFDRYRNCVLDPTGTTATCKMLNCGPGGKGIDTGLGCLEFGDIKNTAATLLNWLLALAGSIGFVTLVYAAYLIITSGADPKNLQAGKELAANTIIALVFLALCVVILNFIGVNVLGLQNLGFNV